MPNYTATVTAASNTVVATEDQYIELLAAAGSAFRVKRVSISMQTPASDARITATFRRTSTAGATGVAYTPLRREPAMRASSVTGAVKNAAASFTVGTLTDLIDVKNVNGRGTYEWIPRNYMEEIIVVGGSRFSLALACNVASQVITTTVEYED
jgi:hypothetical protein